jgi:hypothetical protein
MARPVGLDALASALKRIALPVVALIAACSVDPLVTIGRPCSSPNDCGRGAVCDLVRGLCVPLRDLRVDRSLFDLALADTRTDADGSLADTGRDRAIDAPPRCTDGTLHGQCSTDKPKYCKGGTLVASCRGPDGIAGTADDCGCPAGAVCRANGTCCTTSCSGKTCGSDGCGGSCGVCGGFPCGAGQSPICSGGACSACQCPNYCYNIEGYCGAQGGTLINCKTMMPTATNSNYCICTVHCATGTPVDLDIGDSRDPVSGGC